VCEKKVRKVEKGGRGGRGGRGGNEGDGVKKALLTVNRRWRRNQMVSYVELQGFPWRCLGNSD
jgi:hypothetical protein